MIIRSPCGDILDIECTGAKIAYTGNTPTENIKHLTSKETFDKMYIDLTLEEVAVA